MLRETAKVISVVRQDDGQHVWLDPTGSTQCAQCSVSSSCGQGLLKNYSSNNDNNLNLLQVIDQTNTAFNHGDQVYLEINESSLMSLSFLFYLLPLSLMMIFMLVAVTIGLTEPGIILATVLGFVAGILVLKGACGHSHFKSSHQPNIMVQ